MGGNGGGTEKNERGGFWRGEKGRIGVGKRGLKGGGGGEGISGDIAVWGDWLYLFLHRQSCGKSGIKKWHR